MEGKRITAEMIAPCGLDCNLCKRALAETDPCPGCHGPDEHKPEFCAKREPLFSARKSPYTISVSRRFCAMNDLSG